MDRITAMVQLMERPDMLEQHQKKATERRERYKAANDLYYQRHGVAKRSAQSRHNNPKGVYADHKLRQGFQGQPCQRCGATDRLEVCHIVPIEAGRDDSPENILWLCHGCHVLLHNVQEDWTLERVWESAYTQNIH